MPKYPYRDLGVNFDRNFRNALNANFDDIEADIKELGAGAQQALEAAHEAETQAIYARTSGDYAQDKGDYAAQQGDFAQTQGNYAKSQGDYAKTQGQYAQQVANENKTRWLNPVANFPAIATNYPNPQHGDTVMTLDDGKIYRYENGQWKFTQQYNSTALNNLANELSKQNQQSTTIGHGLNIINASQNSPLDVSIEGRTLVNLLGTDGNCEDISKFSYWQTTPSLDFETKVYGNNSIKVAVNTGDGGTLYKIIQVQAGKYYVALADVKNGDTTNLRLILGGNYGIETTVNDKFKTIYAKYNATSDSSVILEVYTWNTTVGKYFHVDGIRLYEITAEEYANIGTVWNDEEVARRYPYVDSVQHVQNPYVIAEGDNLLPPNLTYNSSDVITVSPYRYTIKATGSPYHVLTNEKIPVIAGQIYTLQAKKSDISVGGRLTLIKYDKNDTMIGGWDDINLTSFPSNDTDSKITFTIPNNVSYVKLLFVSDGIINIGEQTDIYDIMLTLGNEAKPFVPRNPSYLFAEVKLGSLGDKKDILFKESGDWKVLKNIEKDWIIDGKRTINFFIDFTGGKSVIIPNSTNGINYNRFSHSLDCFTMVKYNGNILEKTSDALVDSTDYAFMDINNLVITISDTDSGWGETYTPTQAEIQAYFYGWRMCNGTYGQPYDGTGTKTWYPIGDTDLSRATTTCPTSPAPTISEGKISYYKLSYVRSTPVTEVVTDKVEGDLVVNGATQVEVGSGFTYTEVDGKRTYTKLAPNARYNVTANILSVIANYDTSLKSVVDSVVAKQSDIAAQVGVNVRAIAELYKRVKALGG